MSLIQGQPPKDSGKYSVLRQVNYDRLGVRYFMEDYPIDDEDEPPSLVNIVNKAICTQCEFLVTEAVLTVPTHMLSGLLREAITQMCPMVITNIIANWPLKTLCLRDVIQEEQRDIFQEEMGLDVHLFKGLIKRTQHSKMTCLDLRGFPLNETFSKLIIQICPLLSLKKSQRNAKRLGSMVLKKAGSMKDNKVFKEFIPKMLADVLDHDMMRHGDFDIQLPKGVQMVVKIDMLKLTTQDSYYMDYFVTSCLRHMTPLTIEVSSILIRSELRIGDEVQTSLAPFVVFKGQNHENLQGLCLEDLEDNVLYWTSHNVIQLTNITSLGLLNCNICLQEGRTRLRTSARQKFTLFLSAFPHLRHLDLAMNSFAGCLKEILDVLQQPLEYLNLRECDLNDQDIGSLAQSKHAASLRQLNLCRICGLFVDDSFAVSAQAMIDSLKYYPKLTILDLTRNQLGDNHVDRMCTVMAGNVRFLKSLSLAENPLCVDSVVKILRTCVRIPSLCHIHIPHSHNLMDALNDVPEQSRHQFERKIHDVLKESQRVDDIAIEITAMAFSMGFI